MQRSGKRMRVNVQSIEAESGNHLWADRFDKTVADLFDLQDEIVARLAGQLGVRLVNVEVRHGVRNAGPHPDVLDLTFRAGRACTGPEARNFSVGARLFPACPDARS